MRRPWKLLLLLPLLYLFSCKDVTGNEELNRKLEQEIDSVIAPYLGGVKAVSVEKYLYLNVPCILNEYYNQEKLRIGREMGILKLKAFLRKFRKIIFIQYNADAKQKSDFIKTVYTIQEARNIVQFLEENTIYYHFYSHILHHLDGKKVLEINGVIAAVYRRRSNIVAPLTYIETLMHYAHEFSQGEKQGEYWLLLNEIRKYAFERGIVKSCTAIDFDYFLKFRFPVSKTAHYFTERYQQ